MEMKDEEQFDRFYQSLNKCRTCSHVRMTHSGIEKCCLDVTLTVKGKPLLCLCKEYIPQENLEYLEYKYGKKKGK